MTIVAFRGMREAPKASQSNMETSIVSKEQAEAWILPPFQRPLRTNAKVMQIAEEMKADGCSIKGVVTLGQVKSNTAIYLVDGQHRRQAFLLSGLSEVIVDLRFCRFELMADMADEFVRLNSAIVRMRPDDILRGLEENAPPLAKICAKCSFVGYDNIRRNGTHSPIVGMSSLLRCWAASYGETPAPGNGTSAAQLATTLTDESASDLIRFLQTVYAAWGRDVEYYRLWSTLNLTLNMWLWRKLVMDRDRGVKRSVVLTVDQFKRCAMSVSAASDYVDWLQGRNLTDRDRTPCYARLKAIFTARLSEEMPDKKRVMLPGPAWSHS